MSERRSHGNFGIAAPLLLRPVDVVRSKRLVISHPAQAAKLEPVTNTIFAALPKLLYQRLLRGSELATLDFGDVLYEPGDPIQYVYFPNNCVVSLLTLVEAGRALEVGLVGREGMVGVSLALGSDVSAVRARVQGGGTAMRMKAARFRKELRKSLPLQSAVHRYANALMVQVSQTAACNRFHMVDARLARWLLMMRDRGRSSHIHLTHEFLSAMLGVRREGVTVAAGKLQAAGLIQYSRGNINILDHQGLEAASCACYEIVRAMHDSATREQPWNRNTRDQVVRAGHEADTALAA
jgi:CRP-like cAMP-binding protein